MTINLEQAPIDVQLKPRFDPKRSKRKASNLRSKYITSLFRSCYTNLEAETPITYLHSLSNPGETVHLQLLTNPIVEYLSKCYCARGKADYVDKSRTLRTWFSSFAVVHLF